MEEANSPSSVNQTTRTSSGVAHPDAPKRNIPAVGTPSPPQLEIEEQATSDDQDISLLTPSGKILKLISNQIPATAATNEDQTINVLVRSSIIRLEAANITNDEYDDLDDEEWKDDNRFPDGIEETHVE